MMGTVPCWLVLLALAADAPARLPLRISVVEHPSGDLVGNAEVAIYSPSGLCIRHGQTGLFGHPYTPESVEPLDPALKQLLVVVRKRQGYTVATESATLVFEDKRWRSKEKPPQPPTPERERLTQVAQRTKTAQFSIISPLDNQPVEIWLRLSPIPVCRTAPWQAFVCGGVPCAPPGPPCGLLPPVPPSDAWLPARIPATDVPGLTEAALGRQAAITELGRPPVPEFEWARYGSRWVIGPYGMFWQLDVLPKSSQKPATPNTRQPTESDGRR
jgi:hypothetical protein